MARRILVVEDDTDTREMIGHFLELEGFEVGTAANGRQALDRLVAGERPCVILLDLMMPVMDGWQFRQAQSQDAAIAGIPVIVVSAAGRDRVEQVDADGFLLKPVNLDELLARVEEFCPA